MRFLRKTFLFLCFFLPMSGSASEIIEDYRLAKFQQLWMSSGLQKIAQELSSSQDELTKIELVIDREIRIKTKGLKEKLLTLHNQDLDLKKIPQEPASLLGLRNEKSRILKIIEELDEKLKLAVEQGKNHKKTLASLLKAKTELENAAVSSEQQLATIQRYLETLQSSKIISEPELVSEMDKVMDGNPAIKPLMHWYVQKFEQMLYNNNLTIVGRNGDFKDAPQGTAYLLWDQEKDRLYDFDDFSRLAKIKYPAFKPVKVDLSLEGFFSISDQIYTYDQKFQGKNWSVASNNDYVSCTLSKTFSNENDSKNICRILFPESAHLQFELDREHYVSGADGYLLSFDNARNVGELLLELNDEIKVLLSGNYPASFVQPFQQYFFERKQNLTTDITQTSADLQTKEELYLAETEALKANELKIDSIKKILAKRQQAVTKLTANIEIAKAKFELETSVLVEENENKIDHQRQKITNVQMEINAIQEKIRQTHQKELSLLSNVLTQVQRKYDISKNQTADATVIVNDLEKQLPDALAKKYVRDNLSSEISFKSDRTFDYKILGCFSLKLKGKYFLTQPDKIKLAFNGTEVPLEVSKKFLSKSDLEHLAKFRNKYNEDVYGVAPNIPKYSNLARCNNIYKTISGDAARYFENKNGSPFDAKNWSLIVEGVELGLEDQLRTSGWSKYQRATANQILFRNDITDLKTSIKSQFDEIFALQSRLIDFEKAEDIVILQSMLTKLGEPTILIDGEWGQRSNQALMKVATALGYKYEETSDWSLEIQKKLIQSAFFEPTSTN